MKFKQMAKTALWVTLLAGSLSGCVTALVGSAVGVGANSALDRRSTGAQADDEVLEVRIKNTALSYLKQQTSGATYSPSLSVVSYNRRILLLGQVASESDKQFVEKIARAEANVQGVYNYIDVAGTERTFGAISDDTWGTTKVRTTLLGIQGVYPGRVKIVTYNQVTYVLGVLTPAEQAVVTERVRTTSGVKKVVTLYQNYVAS
ncbi:MAG: BON domain-containing protein [Neisseria sp.]|nr:BON domain-containing protein [Neisseria sp.]